MSPDRDAGQDALQASYQKITDVTGALGDAELMLPTRCAGWAIGDVLYHQLLDARRALVTLATPDFLATLTVEAAIHYLDLTVALPAAPPADPAALALVRRVLDGLLGIPMAGPWDDTTYALKGTGREPVSAADRAQIGPLADLLPLLG